MIINMKKDIEIVKEEKDNVVIFKIPKDKYNECVIRSFDELMKKYNDY